MGVKVGYPVFKIGKLQIYRFNKLSFGISTCIQQQVRKPETRKKLLVIDVGLVGFRWILDQGSHIKFYH